MLGREVNTPADLMFPQQEKQPEDTDNYVVKLISNMKAAHNTARATLKTSLQRMKKSYDVRILERTYKEGDIVYILDSAVLKGKCRKLCSPWKGPAVIVKPLSASLFRIKLRNSLFVVNHDRIKPCRDRQIPPWIQAWLKDPKPLDDHDEDKEEYCMCRKPWQGRFMIQCDYCEEWYHGSCVDVTATDALDIDKFKCGPCKKK